MSIYTNDNVNDSFRKEPDAGKPHVRICEGLRARVLSLLDYRKARNEIQELIRAQKNVERFFAEEKDTTEKILTC